MKRITDILKKIFDIEFVRYIFGGGMITVVNFSVYAALLYFGVVYHIANLIAIIIAKTYGYFVNKIFVYKSKNKEIKENVAEGLRYCIARGFTGVLEYVLVLLFVEMFDFNKIFVKALVVFIVIVLNYILGKFYVFRNKR